MTKVLIIDDEQRILKNTAKILRLEGFQVFTANNGEEGLEKIDQHRPDIILCDIMMPKIDGYQVLRTLKNHPEIATIPFIFLTAKADPTDFRDGMEGGADDYLTKPFTIKQLINAIKTRLAKQQTINNVVENKINTLRSNIALSLPHEVFTPLNSIMGFAEFTRNSVDSLSKEQIKEFMSNIHLSGERLLATLRNFVLFSNLLINKASSEENRKIETGITPDSNLIIRRIAQHYATLHKRENDLQLDLQEAYVKVHENTIDKITNELVSNAFKFSKKGTEIRIYTRIQEKQFLLVVSDKGVGMSNEQIASIDAYIQFDRRQLAQQGNGLGLAIVKLLSELNHGQLTIESKKNEGAVFTVKLPIVTA